MIIFNFFCSNNNRILTSQLYFIESFDGLQNKTASKISASSILSQFIASYRSGKILTSDVYPSSAILIVSESLINTLTGKKKFF